MLYNFPEKLHNTRNKMAYRHHLEILKNIIFRRSVGWYKKSDRPVYIVDTYTKTRSSVKDVDKSIKIIRKLSTATHTHAGPPSSWRDCNAPRPGARICASKPLFSVLSGFSRPIQLVPVMRPAFSTAVTKSSSSAPRYPGDFFF